MESHSFSYCCPFLPLQFAIPSDLQLCCMYSLQPSNSFDFIWESYWNLKVFSLGQNVHCLYSIFWSGLQQHPGLELSFSGYILPFFSTCHPSMQSGFHLRWFHSLNWMSCWSWGLIVLSLSLSHCLSLSLLLPPLPLTVALGNPATFHLPILTLGSSSVLAIGHMQLMHCSFRASLSTFSSSVMSVAFKDFIIASPVFLFAHSHSYSLHSLGNRPVASY